MSRIQNQLTAIPTVPVLAGTIHPASQDYQLALDLFIRDRKLINIRPSTINWYSKQLKYFNKYLLDHDLPNAPADITIEMVENFILYQQEENHNKPESINGRIRALKAFFGFLTKKAYLETNPLKTLKQLRDTGHIVPTFTEEHLLNLLRQPKISTFTGFRDYTIMIILLDTGVRIGELLAVQIDDLVMEAGIPQEIKIKQPKNRKERILPLSQKTQAILRQYLEVRRKSIYGSKVPFLFPNVDCGRLHTRTVQGQIAKYGRDAGIENVRVSPHTFRHTFAKMWVMAEGDILSLQEILGHSSVDMVRNYARLFRTDIKKKHARYSPFTTLETLR